MAVWNEGADDVGAGIPLWTLRQQTREALPA